MRCFLFHVSCVICAVSVFVGAAYSQSDDSGLSRNRATWVRTRTQVNSATTQAAAESEQELQPVTTRPSAETIPRKASSSIRQASYSTSVFLPAVDEQETAKKAAEGAAKAVPPKAAPAPSTPIVDRYPGGSTVLTIQFADGGLDRTTVEADGAFRIYAESLTSEGAPEYRHILPDGTPDLLADGSVVVLRFRNLNPGVYWIVFGPLRHVGGTTMPASSTPVGTFVPDNERSAVKKSFIVPGGREKGEQVEYPRFLRPENITSEFDPGDRVDTKVIQLYYFRDARQIAEYINRNIQDLNQQGYDDAQRFAQQARQQADQSVDERRYQETVAVEAARKTREIQHKIDEARENLNQATQQKQALTIQKAQLENAIQITSEGNAANLNAAISSAESDITEKSKQIDASMQRISELEQELEKAKSDERNNVDGAPTARGNVESNLASERGNLSTLTAEKGKLQNKLVAMKSLKANHDNNAAAITQADETVTSIKADLASNKLPQDLIDGQIKEIEDGNKLVRAEATELRAAQEQFRREVAAGIADRNSYAKGKKESIDPVTQVTISVVGTSRIQVRGPIKGINKIGRMIHQLDTPVGQVKIGIHTIQVNGEHGDRMDFVYERINQEVAHSRFLVNTSSQLLRRAVQEVASEVALAADQGYLPPGCPPDLTEGVVSLNGAIQTTAPQRERRYLYSFFGSDFISELEEMDSELLNSENKLLSLHSMDTISLAGALFAMAHADNPVRQRIVERFKQFIICDLPQRETEYVQALTHVTQQGKSLQNRFRKAIRIDSKNASEIYFNASRTYHFPNTVSYFNDQVPGQGTLNPIQYSTVKLAQALKAQLAAEIEYQNLVLERSLLESRKGQIEKDFQEQWNSYHAELDNLRGQQAKQAATVEKILNFAADALEADARHSPQSAEKARVAPLLRQAGAKSIGLADDFFSAVSRANVEPGDDEGGAIADLIREFNRSIQPVIGVVLDISPAKTEIQRQYGNLAALKAAASAWNLTKQQVHLASVRVREAEPGYEKAKKVLFSTRLLEQFMDDQEEKSVELMEALRSHSSNVDNYLKRLAIAVEDDVAAQFYEPAFQRIRRVSRTYDVTLGQIETTTVLTNNRTLAKVSPAASFEFDLPQRDILLTEALNGSKALATEYGNLLKDGTFLAGTAMLSGQPPVGIVGSNAPIQTIPGLQRNQSFGSELQKLIPDPAIYKFETGTGFEIQPIIQPDGNSIVYGFDYMYSTNVREPVRADEKHLGRIKRHFVHTDVQTSSYELREISRYTVALKASRTDRGVPLFEDLPGVGAAFRPLPSEESSLQTNIILGSSTIYPTVFDLMGLRWSHHVDSMGSTSLSQQKQEQTDRRTELRQKLLQTTRDQVDETIGLPHRIMSPVNLVPEGYKIP